MKKLFLLAGMGLLALSVNAQNTFPSSGSAGVGTASPAFTLDVIGEIGFGGIGAYKKMILGTDASPLSGFNQSSFLTPQTIPGSGAAETAFHFRSLTGVGASNRLSVIIDGSLGLGTISPQAKLHMVGDGTYNTTTPGRGYGSLHLDPQNGQNDNTTAITFGANGTGAVHSSAQAGLYVQSSGSYGTRMYFATTDSYAAGAKTRMCINSEGNVGIGTITPAEKLSVNGTIRSKEVKVETANWPDYVFEESYKIDKLEDLESYIKANKHLPGIPSAKEVEKEGISLGEMNAKLLQKIEEMTLQMIEMNKMMKEQGAKNKDMERRVKELESQTIKKKK
jgi:hypothetical protein